MGVTIITPIVWEIDGSSIQVQPAPFIAARAPDTDDTGPIGAIWLNSATNGIYALANRQGGNTWVTSPGSGVGTFTSVVVSPGTLVVDTGATTVEAFNANGVANFATDVNFLAGTITINADLDLSSASAIELVSTADVAQALYFHANGGVLSTIEIQNQTGTNVASVDINSDVGGLTFTAGLASDDAINFASSGGFDLDAVMQVNIASSENTADSIVINSSAGGIDIIAAGAAAEDLDLVCTSGSANLSGGEADAAAVVISAAAGGIDVTAGGAGLDLDLVSTLGSSNLSGGEAAADAVVIAAAAGGIDLTAGGAALDLDMSSTLGSVNITGGEAAADAVVIAASDAIGGVIIQAGTGGILIGNEADTSPIDVGNFAPTASRTITVAGGTNITAAVTDLVEIAPDGATTNADSVKQVDIAAGVLTTGQSLVNINTGTAASGTHTTSISSGTGGGTKVVNIGNADGLTTVNVDAITLINDSINVNSSINTGTSTGAVAIGNGAAGALSLDSGAGISLDAAAASNFTVAGAGIDLTLDSGAGRVVVNAEEAANNAITLLSAAGGLDCDVALQLSLISSEAAVANSVVIQASAADGGIDCDSGTGGTAIDSTGAVSIDGAAASNFSVSGAGIDLSFISAAGRVVVNGEEAAVDSVRLLSVAGGLDADFANDIAFDNSAGNISANSAAGTLLLDCAGVLELNSSAGVINIGDDAVAQAINIGTGAAARTITMGNISGASSVVVDCGTGAASFGASATAHATTIGSLTTTSATTIQSGTGGLQLSSGAGTRGLMRVDPEVATEAAGATSTVNSNVIHVTFQGITTAAGVDEDITITSSLILTTSAILCNVATISGGNDGDLTIEGVRQASGSVVLHCINSGPAAINTDVHVTVWVLS